MAGRSSGQRVFVPRSRPAPPWRRTTPATTLRSSSRSVRRAALCLRIIAFQGVQLQARTGAILTPPPMVDKQQLASYIGVGPPGRVAVYVTHVSHCCASVSSARIVPEICLPLRRTTRSIGSCGRMVPGVLEKSRWTPSAVLAVVTSQFRPSSPFSRRRSCPPRPRCRPSKARATRPSADKAERRTTSPTPMATRRAGLSAGR